jgi:hypothetical protein
MFICPIRISVSLVVVGVAFLKALRKEPLGGNFLMVTLLLRWALVTGVGALLLVGVGAWSGLLVALLMRS